MDIRIKRAYEAADEQDGYRILVDRIWPRGISKEEARIDLWPKEIAPSKELRQWFEHDPDRWREFKERYFAELSQQEERIQELLDVVCNSRVSLIYGSKETRYNNAKALKEFLKSRCLE